MCQTALISERSHQKVHRQVFMHICTAKFIHQGTHSPMLIHTYTRQLHATIPASTHSKQIILRFHSSRFFPHSQNRHSISSVPTIHHDVPEAAQYRHQNTVRFFFFWLAFTRECIIKGVVASLFLTCILLSESLA